MINKLNAQTSPTEISDWLHECTVNELPESIQSWNYLMDFIAHRIQFQSEDHQWLHWIKLYHESIDQAYQLNVYTTTQLSEKKLMMSTSLILHHPLTPATYRWVNVQKRVSDFLALTPLSAKEAKAHGINMQQIIKKDPSQLKKPFIRIKYQNSKMIRRFLKMLAYLLPLLPLEKRLTDWYQQFPELDHFQQLQDNLAIPFSSPDSLSTWLSTASDLIKACDDHVWETLLTRVRLQLFLAHPQMATTWAAVYFKLLEKGYQLQKLTASHFLERKIDMIRYLLLYAIDGDKFATDQLITDFCHVFPFSAEEARRRSITMENLYKEINYKLFQNEKWSKEYNLFSNLRLILRKLSTMKQWLHPKSSAYQTLGKWLQKFPAVDQSM